MGRYRKVEVRLWNDAEFRDLKVNAAIIWFYFLTSPDVTPLGTLAETEITLSEKLSHKLSRRQFREGLNELLTLKWVEYDKTGLFAMPNFAENNRPENPNQVKNLASFLDLIPECPLLIHQCNRFLEVLRVMGESYEEPFREPFTKRFRKRLPKPGERERTRERERKGSLQTVPSFSNYLKRHHPTVDPLRAQDSTLGNHDPELIQAVVNWLTNSNSPDAAFWRKHVQSLSQLLKSDESGVCRYTKIKACMNGDPKQIGVPSNREEIYAALEEEARGIES